MIFLVFTTPVSHQKCSRGISSRVGENERSIETDDEKRVVLKIKAVGCNLFRRCCRMLYVDSDIPFFVKP